MLEKYKKKLSENQYLENFLVTAIGTPHLNFFTLYIIIIYITVYMVNIIRLSNLDGDRVPMVIAN